MKTDVIIVGAGPTGLMAANQLARFGIDFIVIDLKSAPTAESRAIAVTARSLEIYQQMGLSDTVLEQGTKINSFNVYSEGERKAEVKIGEIGVGLSDFHFLLAFEQSKNEELLYQNLKSIHKNVLWNTEFLELKEWTDNIEILARYENKPTSISAKYLIACDGAKSPIRHQLNFKFEGGTYENKFFVADVIMNWNLEYDKLIVSPSDKNFCAFFPLKGNKRYRVLGTLPKGYDTKEDVSFQDIGKEILNATRLNIDFEKVHWFSVYKLHHRCVNSFNKGNVYLAGDSAHIHSPAGGQGMNTGLQDAYNIAWKMAFVLKGHAHKRLLDTYNEERLPFAQWLMKFTDRMFSIMSSDNWFIARFRKFFALRLVEIIMSKEAIKPIVFRTVSQITYTYRGKSLSAPYRSKQKLKFRTGDRLPYVSENYYTQFTEPVFHLIHITNQNDKVLENNGMLPFPIKMIKNSINDWERFGVKSELFILVRPDNYIALISDTLNEGILEAYFNACFTNNT
ncbi:MAG: FAD-dependent monooxygenase [Bacteroidia bacterium]|jgi:2-polyprenyl-6-methoxyphenol hydroxylase-like FAD-dependent oxidoreductase